MNIRPHWRDLTIRNRGNCLKGVPMWKEFLAVSAEETLGAALPFQVAGCIARSDENRG